MKKIDVTEAIFAIKKEKNLTWEAIAEAVGMTDVWITSACLGMNSCTEEVAEKLVAFWNYQQRQKPFLWNTQLKHGTKPFPKIH